MKYIRIASYFRINSVTRFKLFILYHFPGWPHYYLHKWPDFPRFKMRGTFVTVSLNLLSSLANRILRHLFSSSCSIFSHFRSCPSGVISSLQIDPVDSQTFGPVSNICYQGINVCNMIKIILMIGTLYLIVTMQVYSRFLVKVLMNCYCYKICPSSQPVQWYNLNI